MTTAIVVGSVADVAAKSGMSIAEAFISVEAVAIVDVSGSMSSADSRGGQRRYDVACQELTKLQAAMPDRYKIPGDAVAAYRQFYAGEKKRFATWTRRSPPRWLGGRARRSPRRSASATH
jgi:hypothetical protein